MMTNKDHRPPSAAPAGRVAFNIAESQRTRIRAYRESEHDLVINPGDVLLIARIGDGIQATAEVGITIYGREVAQLAEVFLAAAQEYDENRDWLSAPVTTHGGAA